jgi:hypothetical protein
MTLAINSSAEHAAAPLSAAGTVTISTTAANCLLVLLAATANFPAPAVTGVTSTSGLTWTKRTASTQGDADMEVWWAVASSPLTSEVITAAYSSVPDTYAFVAFAVTGANNTTPFDTNGSLPAFTGFSSSETPSRTVTTSEEPDLLFTFAAQTGGTAVPVSPLPSGQTLINSATSSGGAHNITMAACYEVTSALLSSQAVAWGTSYGYAQGSGYMVDAIQAASGPVAPTLDGYATAQANTTTSVVVTLTTTQSNDIICVLTAIGDEGSVTVPSVSSVSGGGLTWHKRAEANSGGIGSTGQSMELWWALASSPLSAVAITVTYPSAFDDVGVIAFGVNGCYTASPWDSNGSVPAGSTNTTASVTPSFTVSTSNVDDFLIFAASTNSSTSNTTLYPSGFTGIANVSNGGGARYQNVGVCYKGVTAQQSSQTFTWGGSIPNSSASLFDALTANAPPATQAQPRQMMLGG